MSNYLAHIFIHLYRNDSYCEIGILQSVLGFYWHPYWFQKFDGLHLTFQELSADFKSAVCNLQIEIGALRKFGLPIEVSSILKVEFLSQKSLTMV